MFVSPVKAHYYYLFYYIKFMVSCVVNVVIKNMNEVTVFLKPIDAELFIKFQKHHALFKLLVESGVFDNKNANVMLNFDKDGNIGSIERHDFLYSARHELSPSKVP